MLEALVIRDAGPDDLEAIARIQQSSPEGAHWPPADYLAYGVRVAFLGTQPAGFCAARHLGGGETELLNLAVAPELRRQGIGGRLLQDLLGRFPGTVFLEVRASNTAARELYQTYGFKEVTVRKGYYSEPSEDAVVMKNSSCYCHK